MLPPREEAGQRGMERRDEGLSACVISYNRAAILGTCLRALRFADEVLVVDKTSTDGAQAVATRFADRVVTVPWSPTVEETRAHAVSLCRHDWILLLDDDECLSAGLVGFIQAELRAPRAEAYALPLRHYILGVHDERAYYWPEHHVRLFRRDAVSFGSTVHAGMTVRTDRVLQVPPDDGTCIHHLSHPDVTGWIERTNRYTSRPDRARAPDPDLDLVAFAHARIDHWHMRSTGGDGNDYPAAVALLRAIYDMVDRLKDWEERRGLDGQASFRRLCAMLDAEHGNPPPRSAAWRRWTGRARAALLAAPRPGWLVTANNRLSRPAFRRPPE
jgi:glycosyltransferase involved in cell wall biosynthesis